MKVDDDEYVISGPEPYTPVPEGSLGKALFDSLLSTCVATDAMVDAYTGEKLSYQALLEETCKLAEALRAFGSGPNTFHAVCSQNSIYFLTPVLASLYIGSTVVPINHTYTQDELKHSLNLTTPSIVFCSRAVKDKFLQFNGEFIKKIIVIDDTRDSTGVISMRHFVSEQLKGAPPVLPYKFQPYNDCDPTQQVAFIMSSSGTTGLPKGVMLTHTNILVRIEQSRDPRMRTRVGESTALILMPLFHGYGLNYGITSIINKDKMVLLNRFEPEIFLKTIQDHRVFTLPLAPPLAIFLAKTPLVSKYDMSSVQEVFCGAAPLNKEIEDILKKRLNIRTIRQGYGLTEANLAVTLMKPTDTKKPGSVGTVITFMTLKVRDPESGKSLGPHQIGEICIKGPMVMKGYYKNAQATRETFTQDGWLKTGDLGYYDEDRYFFIVDRLKELIKYKGFQVAPAELEAVLINHPKVLDVGVVGLPDELAGELPVAFVVKKDGVDVTEKELQDFVAGHVSPQKRLRGGVIFVPAIPKNPSGKILRRELRKQLTNLSNPKSKL